MTTDASGDFWIVSGPSSTYMGGRVQLTRVSLDDQVSVIPLDNGGGYLLGQIPPDTVWQSAAYAQPPTPSNPSQPAYPPMLVLNVRGTSSYFVLPSPLFDPSAPVVGPDEALWFVAISDTWGTPNPHHAFVRLDRDGSLTTYPIPDSYGQPTGPVVVGPDHAVWQLMSKSDQPSSTTSLIRIGSDGAISGFPVHVGEPGTNPDEPTAMCVGADQELWFGPDSALGIGRATTGGVVTHLRTPTAFNFMVCGPDGGVWVADNANRVVHHIARDGTTTQTGPFPGTSITAMALGADNRIWIVVQRSGANNLLIRVTG